MSSHVPAIVLIVTLLLGSFQSTRAFETDQYDLPPEPLADIGDEVSQHVQDSIFTALNTVNSEIEVRTACLNDPAHRSSNCGSAAEETQRLAELRTPDAVEVAVYKLLGDGDLFTTVAGKWFGKHKFAREPSRYKPSYAGSIYLTRPFNYLTLSPTVRIYGSEFGFDKIDHFFQQGYKYLRKYNEAIARGIAADKATEKAVGWGKMTERTYFGILVSGVYSNADLFANYAGMRFYQGLTKEITINGRRRPPIVVLREGEWSFNDRIDPKAEMLRPFIGDQLNEALNPSGYSFFLHKVVRKVVKNRACNDWRKLYPDATAAEFQKRTLELENWNGEDYGFTHKSKSIPIAICFEDKLPSQ